ncbi:DUF4258 domain-containing protein [Rhodopseudomonas palustris]|nr:DUF4258 domain-containing protein [Rhodopseudomonas palustris]
MTDHAIEAMYKRHVTVAEIITLIENGDYFEKDKQHGWIFYYFPARSDNNVCAAIVIGQAIVIKTIMVNWTKRSNLV